MKCLDVPDRTAAREALPQFKDVSGKKGIGGRQRGTHLSRNSRLRKSGKQDNAAQGKSASNRHLVIQLVDLSNKFDAGDVQAFKTVDEISTQLKDGFKRQRY
jgi:hypothetical protein